MIYTSKRRKFKDFIRTRNWKYYLIFLILFITLVAMVVIIAGKNNVADKTKEESTSGADITTTAESSVEIYDDVKGRYNICINKSTNIISIYSWDEDENIFSSVPERCMRAVINNDIAEGEYSFSKEKLYKSSWYSSNGVYYRYFSGFGDTIIFHSAKYNALNDKNSLNIDSYNGLLSSDGDSSYSAESDFGIVLLCSDAKWIYENCSYASIIRVYSDAKEELDNITTVVSIPDGLTWDPSDISNDSPFCQTVLKYFNCTMEYLEVTVGTDISSLSKYIQATDENDADVSEYAYTMFGDKFDTPGNFEVKYIIADIYGNVLSDTIKVEVKEEETISEEDTTESSTKDTDSFEETTKSDESESNN